MADNAVPEFTGLASKKLAELQRNGYRITGYCFERDVEGTRPQRGFIDSWGFVGWWRPEMVPDFTDTARAALLWVLWHHQGGSSPVGQPIRFALGMGQHDRLNEHQLAEAKRWERLHPVNPSVFPRGPEPLTDEQIVGVMHSIPINAAPSYHIAFARAIEAAHGIGETP